MMGIVEMNFHEERMEMSEGDRLLKNISPMFM